MPEADDEPEIVSVTTRIPSRLHAHLKSLAKMQYGTIQIMHRAMMAAFLEDEPWTTAPDLWRRTRAIKERDKSRPVGMKYTGWEQVNFSLRRPQRDAIEGLLGKLYFNEKDPEPVTLSIFLYGACYWWGWYVQPPRWAKEERRKAVFAALPECVTLSDEAISEMKEEIETSRLEAVKATRTRRSVKASEGADNG